MSDVKPVMFRWKTADVQTADGELRRVTVMVPHTKFSELCSRQFIEGEDYALAPLDDIPSKSRAGFFAEMNDLYASLHENDKRFHGFDHFRKMATIYAGWCHHAQYVMSTAKDVKAIVAEARKDAYAIVSVEDNVVNVWTARSLAGGGLRGKAWQEFKEKALKWGHEQVDHEKYERRLEEKIRRRGR